MIKLNVIEGDIVEARADGVFVSIDGAAFGMEGNQFRRVERAFAESFDLSEEVESQVDYPVGGGQAREVELPEEAPWKYLFLLASLHHDRALSAEGKRAMARTAFESAVVRSRELGCRRVATTIMAGGWRISPMTAFSDMLNVLLAQPPDPDLEMAIHVLPGGTTSASNLRGQARTLEFQGS